MANTFSVAIPVPDPSQLRTYDDATWDFERCKVELLSHVRQGPGDTAHIEAIERAMSRLDCWRACVEYIATLPADAALGRGLLAFWRAYGLWSVPRALKADIAVLADAMRRHLAPYTGPARTLYRGQHEVWHRAGQYGIAWTESREVAHRLAFHHAAYEGTAVVLRAEVPAERIIGPLVTELDDWINEREFIVDPRDLQPEVLEVIPDPFADHGGGK